MHIGILALQGGVAEHEAVLHQLGHSTSWVRRPQDLKSLEAIVIPGGESSVIDKLARAFELAKPLQEAIDSGLPTLATCAGLIYCAREIANPSPGQQSLGVLDVEVQRNAFGRQRESFDTTISINEQPYPVSFIRAPEIISHGPKVEVLARVQGRIIAVQQGNIIGLSCHPEEHGDTRLYQWWLEQAAH